VADDLLTARFGPPRHDAATRFNERWFNFRYRYAMWAIRKWEWREHHEREQKAIDKEVVAFLAALPRNTPETTETGVNKTGQSGE
jgi:hypothetical protein